MTSQTRSAGNGQTDGLGAFNWTSPTNILSHDSARALATQGGDVVQNTDGLVASNFGFTVPDGATINGIVARIERSLSSTSGISVVDVGVQLVKAGIYTGAIYDAGGWPTADAYQEYGADDDLWSTTWTPAQVNASNFGVVLIAEVTTVTVLRSARVNHIEMIVYYTEAGGGGGQGAFFAFF